MGLLVRISAIVRLCCVSEVYRITCVILYMIVCVNNMFITISSPDLQWNFSD
jgi:hypothetical protein